MRSPAPPALSPSVGAGLCPARPVLHRAPGKPLPPLPKGRGTSRRLVEGFRAGQTAARFPQVRAWKNPPVTASPCQPPLGKGANIVGRGDHTPPRWCGGCRVVKVLRIATASVRTGFAMTHYRKRGGRQDTWVPPYNIITKPCRAGPVCPAAWVRRLSGARSLRHSPQQVRPVGELLGQLYGGIAPGVFYG